MTPTKFKILTLVGGISENSLNQKLFMAAQELAPSSFEMQQIQIKDLPFYSQDLEMNPPRKILQLKQDIKDCQGVLFITPEYNRSFPGVLKNAIDWGSRPYGQNSWDGKPAAVIGASIGAIGTFGAQHHLRQVLAYLNMPTLGQPEFYFNASQAFAEDGRLKDPKTKEFLLNFWEAYTAWIQKFSVARTEDLLLSTRRDRASEASTQKSF